MNSENKEFKEQKRHCWSEMSQEDKINFLKNELYRTQLQVQSLCGYINTLLQHEHIGSRIVKPIANPNSELYDCNLYFRVNGFE